MKKSYLVMAAAAALFAACSSNDLAEEKSPQTTQPTVDEQAVTFDAYVNRGLTRAGVDGPITTTNLTNTSDPAGISGFGVFGYYTDGERYSGITKPNFFYNQQVKYSGGIWTYDPLKYWPNEFGSDAVSDQVDRVTLFAYAPYVPVTPLTGVVTGDQVKQETNIIGMSRNNVTGDPFVRYVATMDATNSVDLCYGVAAEDFTSSNSTLNQNKIEKGKPYIDVTKPGTDANSKIKFDFKHATAQLRVTVDADVTDLTSNSPLTNGVQTDYTRIWIRSVTFEGITQKGALNLNGGEWYDINGTNKITTGSLTLYDGRKDGKEAILDATNETPSSINSIFVQSAPYELNSSTGVITNPSILGVTKTPKNLFVSSTDDDPVFVIPTNERMKVTIVYDVETVDKNLAYYLSDGSTQGSTIENSISKTIESFGNITAGYCYTLKLHLGMRTVDFDAEVTGWQNMAGDIDLPSNLQTFVANAPQTNATVNIGYNAGRYDFAVSNLIAGKSITPDVESASVISTLGYTDPVLVNGSGIGECSIPSIPNNVTPKNKPLGWIKLYDGNKAAQLTINQMACPLGLTASALAASGTSVTLTATTATGTVDGDWTGAIQKVMKGGTDITALCSIAGSGATGTLTIPAATAGDNYTITIKVGDAPAETVTVVVPTAAP